MKPDQRDQARNLYMETSLTQAQIADLVGIAHKTMSFWANEGEWRRLKQMTKEMPGVVVESMFSEIAEINDVVRSRPSGKRFATKEEAEIRRKTLASIKYVKERETVAAHCEVMLAFMHYVRPRMEPAMFQELVKQVDDFLRPQVHPLEEKYTYSFYCPPPIPEEDPHFKMSEKNSQYLQRWNDFKKQFDDIAGTDDAIKK